MSSRPTEVPRVLELALECVWSDRSGGCCCESEIPAAVVAAAWQRELDATGDGEARFFHFIWQAGVWLAYGLSNGDVRGVYCPSHNSERAERSHAAMRSECDVVYDLPLAA